MPGRYDLRRRDWDLVDIAASPDQVAIPLLTLDGELAVQLTTRRERAPVVLIGVEDAAARGGLLADGIGEALTADVELAELEQRTSRVAAMLDTLPRARRHGDLQLELLLRDGWVRGRRLGLFPREFALLWRLAETPGEPVEPGALLSDVWQLSFRPETNSLAVHVCRLRAKLAVAGLADVVRTTERGAYVLAPGGGKSAIPLTGDRGGLDAHVRLMAPQDHPAGEEA